jgi:hypothetical protein
LIIIVDHLGFRVLTYSWLTSRYFFASFVFFNNDSGTVAQSLLTTPYSGTELYFFRKASNSSPGRRTGTKGPSQRHSLRQCSQGERLRYLQGNEPFGIQVRGGFAFDFGSGFDELVVQS